MYKESSGIEIAIDRLERRSNLPGYVKSYCEGGSCEGDPSLLVYSSN